MPEVAGLTEEQLAAIQALYAQLPRIECQRKCQESCGPVAMAYPEKAAVEAVHGQPLRKMNKRYFAKHGLQCPLLVDGACSVYAARPAICRMWGVVEGMPCPHGCKTSQVWSDAQAAAWLRKLRLIAGSDYWDFLPRQMLDLARRHVAKERAKP